MNNSRVSSDEVISRVAAVMDWPAEGAVADLGDTPVLVMGALDEAEHTFRSEAGALPLADSFLLRCALDTDPDFLLAPPPVAVRGFVAVRLTWQAAAYAIGTMTAFGLRVVALPAEVATSDEVLVEAIVTGVGVIARCPGGWWLVQPPTPRESDRSTWVHRWVEELVYDAFLIGRREDTRDGKMA